MSKSAVEYKVRFLISYKKPDGSHMGNGQLHFVGRTLEEAVEKVLTRINVTGNVRKHTGAWGDRVCTSMTIQRGRRKGENIKWAEYITSKEGKALIQPYIQEEKQMLDRHQRTHGWEYLN